ncbi:MAG: VCBS repeat-containing protein [Bryobacteraceae bacterium]
MSRLPLLGLSCVLLVVPSVGAPKPAVFSEHLIASGLKSGYQVVVADMNKDGKPDIIALASGMPELVWYENPTWRRHVIAGAFNRMINLAAWDTDGDGIPEIVLAHEFANQAKNSIGMISLLTHDEDPDAQWKVTEIDRIPTSHRLRWADIYGNREKVLISAPLTGGKAEAPDYRDNTPLVLYRPDHWIRETISEENEGVVHGIYITDWDGNGGEDILTASFAGIHLFHLSPQSKWIRTEVVKGDPSPWPKSGASDLAMGKVLGARFIASVEPWHGNQVCVYTEKPGLWQRQVIDAALVDGHTILTADLNGDGIDEIVAGFRGEGRSVNVYYARDRKGERWTKSVLDQGGIAAAACAAADLNGDGRIDLTCIGSATANLKWYENKGPLL